MDVNYVVPDHANDPDALMEHLRTAAHSETSKYRPMELDKAAMSARAFAQAAMEARGRIKAAAKGREPTKAQQADLEKYDGARKEYSALAYRLNQAAEERSQADKAEGQAAIERGDVEWSNPDEVTHPYAHVSGIQYVGGNARGESSDSGRVLNRSDKMTDWVRRNDRTGVSANSSDSANLSVGKILRGWVTGQWEGAAAEQRVMLEGTQAGGGVLVPSPLSAQVIDRARNASRCIQLGAGVIPMTSETLTVPRIVGSPNPAWRNENALVPEGDLTFDSVKFRARSLALVVRCSRELLEDSSPDAADIITRDLALQVGTELDRVILRGSGVAPEPAGIRNQSGVNITAHGGANGASPGYDMLLDAVQTVRAGNFEPTGILMAPRVSNSLAKAKDSTGAYLAPPVQLSPLTQATTNQIPQNLTTGTSTDTSEVYVGDWSMAWLGMRTNMLFTLDQRYSDYLQVGFLVHVRADVQLAQPGAFSVITGVRP